MKLSIYRSREVEADLAVLRERFAGLSDPEIMRLALGALANDLIRERERAEARCLERDGRRVWN